VSPVVNPERIRSFLAKGLDWDSILAIADEHGVQGMLAWRLEENECGDVPAAARVKIQARMRARQLFALSLSAELFRILDDFSKAHIEVVPVKGPVLSQVAYGDPGVRSFGDLDLLLAHRDIRRAIERMLAMGFTPDVPAEVLLSGRIPGEYLFRRAGTGGLIELHTEKTFRHYPKPMRIEAMMERRRQVLLDGRPVPAMSLEDELVFDCIHGGKDFWERLMWISDVAALLAKCRDIDWEKTRAAAREVRVERMLRVGVQLAAIVFGMKLPEQIAKEVGEDRGPRGLCAEILAWLPYAGHRPPGVAKRALYRMNLGGGGISGFRYLLRLTLSPAQDDWEPQGGTRQSWLAQAVRRPFRLIRKYGSGE
jgi:hypothetical protein